MLTRIIRGSLMRRHPRKLLSVAAVTLGIVVTTAVATIALDVGDRVSQELRSFGANISIRPAADSLPVAVGGVDYKPEGAGRALLAETDLVKLKTIFWRNNIVAFSPLLETAATIEGRPVVLVGSWFERQIRIGKSETFRTGLKSLHPAWKVEGQWPSDDAGNRGSANGLIGHRLARLLDARPGQVLTIDARSTGLKSSPSEKEKNASAEMTVAGVLDTGGPEDDRVLVPLLFVQRLTGLDGKIRRVEVSALTKPEDSFAHSDVTRLTPAEYDRWFCTPYVSAIAYQIQQAIPGTEAKPVYQVADTEGKILNRMGVLMALLTAAALITTVLAVASMMLATVLDQRVEIALFKSLGATDARVVTLLLIEVAFIGLAGGIAGYFGGSLLATRLSLAVFGRPAGLHWAIFPLAVLLALTVAVVGSALPLRKGLRVSPAVILRS